MDESILLCEECGYNISNVSPSGKCSECARAIATSLPEHRKGTRWQNRRGVVDWFVTNWRTLRHPRRHFESMRVEFRHAWPLLVIHAALTGILIADPWIGTLVHDPARLWRGHGELAENTARVASFLGHSFIAAAIIIALTIIEYFGIRFVAARRGWRLTRPAAWQICCHASVGWMICGLGAIFSLALMFSLERFFGITPRGSFVLPPPFNSRLSWYELVGVGGIFAGYALGLIAFEWLVFIGVRRCKYAAAYQNAPAPLPSPHETTQA